MADEEPRKCKYDHGILATEAIEADILDLKTEVNAKDFGVVGDGVTNDTTAMNAALVAAVAAGKRLVVPKGTYMMQNVAVPAGAEIRGFGRATVLKKTAGGGERVLHLTAGAGSDVTISDLTVDGNSAGGGVDGGGAAIDSNLNSRVTVRNVKVINALAFGIRMLNGDDFAIKDCEIISSTRHGIVIQCTTGGDRRGVTIVDNVIDRSSLAPDAASNHGILCRGSDDGMTRTLREVVIANNRVRQPSGSNLGICIETWSHQLALTGNVCTGGAMGISTGFGTGVTVTGNSCTNNTIIGIELIAGGGGTGFGFSQAGVCSGNTIEGEGVCQAGISSSGIEGPDEIIISDNVIRNTVAEGIHILGVPRCILSGNYISWDGSVPASTNWGIRVQNPARGVPGPAKVVCVGNLIDGLVADVNARGIQIEQSSGDPDINTVIMGNLIANVNDAIFYAPVAAVIFGTCIGNSIEDSVTNPIRTVASSGGTAPVVRWANHGAIPSRAAYASTDAMLIALGVITA